MAQSRNRGKKMNSEKIKKINQLKQKTRIMERSNQTQNVFQQPAWDASTRFEITGMELETLIKANEANSQAAMALQNIINTGLLNGTITMKYFKLNGEGTGYEPLTEEESKPYKEEMQSLIAQAKGVAEKAVAEAKNKSEEQIGKTTDDTWGKTDGGDHPAPRLDAIVNQHGEPYESLGEKKLKVVE